MNAWDELKANNPILESLDADGEALLVNRMSDPPQHAIVPIDECYRLVGLVKVAWEGISGRSRPRGGDRRVLRRAARRGARRRERHRRATAPRAGKGVAEPGGSRGSPTRRTRTSSRPTGLFRSSRSSGSGTSSARPPPRCSFELEATEATGRSIYTVALTAMVEIEPSKRRYEDAERERLVELFGEPERWASTTSSAALGARPRCWSRASPGRRDSSSSCRAPTTTRSARRGTSTASPGGEAPLRFHFNGTIFYGDDDGRMQLTQVPWDCSARFSMPVDGLARDDRGPLPVPRLGRSRQDDDRAPGAT